MPPKWDSPHQGVTVRRWIKRGLLLREGETYKGIYSFVMSIDNCQLCSVKFTDENYNDKKCMDHDHSSGFFRQVLCKKCNTGCDRKINENNKIGHRWVSLLINKRKNGTIDIYFKYTRTGFSQRTSLSLTKLICYSFIHLLKKPI